MSKSVLVINTPKYCALCVLRSGVLHPFCRVNNRDITDLSIRPDWCPLKPLPEKNDRSSSNRSLGQHKSRLKWLH